MIQREALIRKLDGRDQNGEYLIDVWEKDLEKRKTRSRSADSQLNEEDLEELLNSNGEEKEERFCELVQGDYFGELGLIHGKPKTMSVWCMQDTHFLTVDRNSLHKVLERCKARIDAEKVNFLKSLPAFKLMPASKLKTVIESFKPVHRIRGAYLFKEDEPATHIYLIVEGELSITKRVHFDKPDFIERTDDIFKDPLKVAKLNSKFNVKNGSTTMQVHHLESVTRNQFLGVEDVVNQN